MFVYENSISDITRLEYIEMKAWGQYIDTGFKFNTNKRIEGKFLIPPTVTTSQVSFGSRHNGVVRGIYNVSTSIVLCGNSSWGAISNDVLKGQANTFDLNQNILYLNGGKYTGSNSLKFTENDLNLYLFALNSNGAADAYAAVGTRIYYFKAYDENDKLVLDLIPVKDKDGRVCMFDRVEKKFHYDESGGDFIAGGIFNKKLRLVYFPRG